MADLNLDPGPGPRGLGHGLRGRVGECAVLDGLLTSARNGKSGVLVLRGEAGIGKTALLDYVLARASGCRTTRAVGVESEMELAFAGLHQLCAPFLTHLDRLPPPQRDALGTAFGLRVGETPDRFLIGLAVLSLLSEVADEEPLLCVVDDAQWLDHATCQALAFVARRLQIEPIALIFAVRESAPEHPLTGLDELTVPGLVPGDSRALLQSVVTGPLDERIRDRIVAETRGNPLALMELPRGLTPQELAGGFGLPDAPALAGRIEDSFIRRLQPLPTETRTLLVVAAAEPVGDPAVIWRAADQLGIPASAATPAAVAGLVDFAGQIRFRHPLVRSAVYRTASAEDRREVHRALATATDPDVDHDRRAWHRAHAAAGPDEGVAQDLENSATRAQIRGGLAAQAAFLEEAARLSPDPIQRGRRAMAAARAKHDAGAPDAALALLAMAQARPLDEVQRAKVDLLRAEIGFASRRSEDAHALLIKAALQAAGTFEALDVELARETYLEAFTAAVLAGQLGSGNDLTEVARAARTAPAPPGPPRAHDLLLDGLALLFTEGRAAGTAILKDALRAFRSDDLTSDEGLRWLWIAGRVADDLWDDESWEVLCARHVAIARQAGALTVLPIALRSRIFVHVFSGELTDGSALMQEVRAVTDVTGSHLPAYGAVALAAWRGREPETTQLVAATLAEITTTGEGMGLSISHHAIAVLNVGLGHYPEALAAAQLACQHGDLGIHGWALIEVVEAASRSGELKTAIAALDELTEATQAAGTDWALGIEARSRAQLSDGDTAEELYREAIARLGRTRLRIELARAHLVYGEWLRRRGRRVDAREQLRTAHDTCTDMGVEAFAERARRELVATGETVRKRSVETSEQLTAQEEQIARLAAAGRTNPEIAAEMFISARTVEWHLRKVYSKLGVASRRQLGGAMPHGVVDAGAGQPRAG